MLSTQPIRFVIIDAQGRFAAYNMAKGPYLTDNPNFRYQWNTEAEAKAQLSLYAGALKTELTVKPFSEQGA